MTIDRFTLQEFEKALPVDKDTGEYLWAYLGMWKGEHEYILPVMKNKEDGIRIRIRSSVHEDGMAAKSGEDSIRVWLEGGDVVIVSEDSSVDSLLGGVIYRSLGKLKNRWVTRVSGWDTRLNLKLRELYVLGMKIKRCPVCNEWLVLRNVKKQGKNYGRIFMVCNSCQELGDSSQFRWLTPQIKEKV